MKQKLKTTEKLQINLCQLQTMQLLQMNQEELSAWMDDFAQSSPVVDFEKYHAQKTPLPSAPYSHTHTSSSKAYTGTDKPAAEPVWDDLRSLREHLLFQLHLGSLPEAEKKLLAQLTDYLDDNGYFPVSPKALAEDLGVTEETLSHLLDILHTYDPPGIGVFSLTECLLLQLQQLSHRNELAEEIVCHRLPSLAGDSIHALAQALAKPEDEVRDACRLIRTLSPKPGLAFQRAPAQTPYIHPDIIIEGAAPDFRIVIPSRARLVEDALSTDLVRHSNDPDARKYIRDGLAQLRLLNQCILMRERTLENIAGFILERQYAFFCHGNSIAPLSMADIANGLHIHKSTVSRALRGKYLQCGQGVYPIHTFLSRRLSGSGGSVQRSAFDAKAAIQSLVREEDVLCPLSDEDIAGLLQGQGYQIARRTVAKYRNQLHIPRKGERKRV